MKKIVLLISIIAIFICFTSFAQEVTTTTVTTETTAPATSAKPRFDIGAGYWYTWASLDTDLIGSVDALPYYLKGDKLSELNYDTDAGLFVVNVDAYLFWRLYADALIAWGNIDDGEQIDSDWAWQVSTAKWYQSKSDAEGDVTTWNINGYFRILEEPEDKGYLDVSVGYLYYQDDIEHMTNLLYSIEEWEAVNDPVSGQDSSDKYTFDGIRFGARARIKLHDRIAIKGSAGIIPWLDAERDGYWNLREMDIKGDAEGTGFDVNIGIEFKITKNLFIEAGYKYMDFDTDKGDYTHSWADGTELESKGGWGSTEAGRGGFYAMGRLKI